MTKKKIKKWKLLEIEISLVNFKNEEMSEYSSAMDDEEYERIKETYVWESGPKIYYLESDNSYEEYYDDYFEDYYDEECVVVIEFKELLVIISEGEFTKMDMGELIEYIYEDLEELKDLEKE